MTKSEKPPTLSELRNGLMHMRTGCLPMVRAERYIQDLSAALNIIDRMLDHLGCRQGWERWIEATESKKEDADR